MVSSEVSLLSSSYYFGIHLGSYFLFVVQGQKYHYWINYFIPFFQTISVNEKSYILILNNLIYNCYPLGMINHPRGQVDFDGCDSGLDAETVEYLLVYSVQSPPSGLNFLRCQWSAPVSTHDIMGLNPTDQPKL